MRRPAEQARHGPADERNPRRSADQHDLVDLRRLETRVGERLAARRQRAVHDRLNQRFEFRAGDVPLVALSLVGHRFSGAAAGDHDVSLFAFGQIPFRLDDRLTDLLNDFRRRTCGPVCGPAEAGPYVRPSVRGR